MQYLGDIIEDATIQIPFNTMDSAGASVVYTGGEVKVFKDSNLDESTAGVTTEKDFSDIPGANLAIIDTSADAFYAVGGNYNVMLDNAIIDSRTINAWIGSFSIENRSQQDSIDNITVALETDELLTNGDFEIAGVSPSTTTVFANWTNTDNSGSANTEVEDVDNGQGHGGTSGTTHACNIWTDNATFVLVSSGLSTVVVGQTYKLVVDAFVTGGSLRVTNNAATADYGTIDSTGTHVIYFTAESDTGFIIRNTPLSNCDVTIDNVSITETIGNVVSQNNTDIGALNDFDPANDAVANVTLVDTTTTNTDVRGTDGALTSATSILSPPRMQ